MGFTRKFLRRLIVGVVWNTLSLAVMLFLPAGTLDWWRAWVLVGVVGVCFLVMMVGVLRTRPELMKERFRSIVQKGQPLVDRVLLLAFVISYGDSYLHPVGCVSFSPAADTQRLGLIDWLGALRCRLADDSAGVQGECVCSARGSTPG
jgi:hypothetical protein